eukprot:6210649-Pleurochrysis_carterae.AAC.14
MPRLSVAHDLGEVAREKSKSRESVNPASNLTTCKGAILSAQRRRHHSTRTRDAQLPEERTRTVQGGEHRSLLFGWLRLLRSVRLRLNSRLGHGFRAPPAHAAQEEEEDEEEEQERAAASSNTDDGTCDSGGVAKL